MATGRRNRRQQQKQMWGVAADLPNTAAYPFYRVLNKLLDEHGFDGFVEGRCSKFYAPRPSSPPAEKYGRAAESWP